MAQRRPSDIAQTSRLISRIVGGSHCCRYCRVQLPIRGLHTGANVEPLAVACGGGRHIECPRDVADIHVVASIGAATEHTCRFTVEKVTGKDRNYPRLTKRILSRPIDVGWSNEARFKPVKLAVDIQVQLTSYLGCRIWRLRINMQFFGSRKMLRLTIDGTARRGMNNATHASATSGFRQTDCGPDVHLSIQKWILDRTAHIDLGCQVKYDLRLYSVEDRLEVGFAYILLKQLHFPGL